MLEALSKPPYEPLPEAYLKHLTLKTVFLLAMASAGRHSELQALVFGLNIFSSNPKGQMLFYISVPSSCARIRNLLRLTTVPTGKSDFGAPNCPVRALRYYHRYMTEHPELRKGRQLLFVLIKDNNTRKELSAATISRWICTTIVDFHAALRNSKSIPSNSQSS